MTPQEATESAQRILQDPSASVFKDKNSILFPYLVAIKTPSGELGVVATGRTYQEVLSKAKRWKMWQKAYSLL